jgi:hypothetical protein
MMPLAVVTAAVILVGWFPINAIWHQQSQLDTTATQITAIKNQQRALTLQAAATLLAREQDQLVRPGQSLIQVLPGNGSVSQSTGDPGLQPLVSPSSVSTLVAATPAKTSTHSSAKAFVSRLVRTLEFWR